MNLSDIQALCPKATNITITGGTVAMKVGEFAQAVGIDLNKDHSGAKILIKNLYLDLLAMNRQVEAQQLAASRIKT